jgi:hypothetical protein
LFNTYRAKRLASAEQELDGCNGQLPSEDDIEQEFLTIVSRGTEREMVALQNNECEHNQGCSHRENPAPPSGTLSCYDDNEARPANYYHDKDHCDCSLCIDHRV